MPRTALSALALLIALAACSGSSPSPSESESTSSPSTPASAPASQAASDEAAASEPSVIGTGIATLDIEIGGGDHAGHYVSELTTGACSEYGDGFWVIGGAEGGDIKYIYLEIPDDARAGAFEFTAHIALADGDLTINGTQSTGGRTGPLAYAGQGASIDFGGQSNDGGYVDATIDCHQYEVPGEAPTPAPAP